MSKCGGFQLAPVVNSTHNLVIFPSDFGLGKMRNQVGRASDSERADRHLSFSVVAMMICDFQHVPMSFIRDEDRYCCINGIFTLVSSLSVLLPSFLFWWCAFAALCCVRFVNYVTPPYHFVVARPMDYTRYYERAVPYELVFIVRHVLFKAVNH